jgi:phenylpropionate dioxygenase-like ring-hydroxylating dioxygenase large terminal subunit
MGSTLDSGKITESGCLQCPYHGLEYSGVPAYATKRIDTFGQVVEHEGKLFWAHRPIEPKPPSVPFYNNSAYSTSCIEFDVDGSLTDCAYNTMDLRHPEYVHGNAFGFGSSIPPVNIRHYSYPPSKHGVVDRVGLSFHYKANELISRINNYTGFTHNFHMFVYPTFSWSKVTFDINKHLIIGVHLLPVTEFKTRWYITICHNYYISDFGKQLMRTLASTIVGQDRIQMSKQSKENGLKKALLFSHIFPNEEPILWLQNKFKSYIYPSIQECHNFVKLFGI